jgi:plastocyanin
MSRSSSLSAIAAISSARSLALAVALIGALTLAACGSAPSNGPTGSAAATINLSLANFAGNTNVTIHAGQSVAFVDPSSGGGTHNLVTGTGGQYSAEAGAPAEFTSSGIPFNPGDTKDITFPTAGIYHITCTIHFYMSATVTVTA